VMHSDLTSDPSRNVSEKCGIGDDTIAMAIADTRRAFVAAGGGTVLGCCGCGRRLDMLYCETQVASLTPLADTNMPRVQITENNLPA
jgi:hypothetical protein